MKCINQKCRSTNILVHDAESSILNKAANGIGALFCALGCLTPYHYVASKSFQQFGKEVLKSSKITYECNDCGCTWHGTKWG